MSAHAFSSSLAGKVPTPMAADARKGPNGARNSPTLRAVLPTLTTKSSHRQQNATGERVSLRGLVPTLTVKGNYNRAGSSPRAGDGLATRIAAGPLNPQWLEWLMGFPDGWTESAHSGTRLSRSAPK